MWDLFLLLWVPAELKEDSSQSILRLSFHADLLKASHVMEIFFFPKNV